MAVYLIHFDVRLAHAQHYLGYTEHLQERLASHRDGSGARLIQVVNERGITWRLARVWPEGDRQLERLLKKWHGSSPLCPICNPSATRWGEYGGSIVDTETLQRLAGAVHESAH